MRLLRQMLLAPILVLVPAIGRMFSIALVIVLMVVLAGAATDDGHSDKDDA